MNNQAKVVLLDYKIIKDMVVGGLYKEKWWVYQWG